MTTKIKDTGVGIPEKELDKLFKFFGKILHHEKINENGMGLGLSISKMII